MRSVSHSPDTPISDTDHRDSVLVVDDSPSIHAMVKEALEGLGCMVETASTGREAIDRVARQAPTLILLDYQLEDMNGKEVVQKLSEPGLNVPFIIMTGHGDERIAVDMMKLGAADYLVKDEIFLKLLPQVVKQMLSQIRTARRLEKAEEDLRSSEELLRAFANAIPDTAFIFDENGRYLEILADQNSERSKTRSKYKGKRLHEVCPPQEADLFLSAIRKTLQSGEKQIIEYQRIENGELRTREGHLAPMAEAGNSPPKVIWLSRDITCRKRVEQKLRESEKRYRKISQEFQTLLNGIPDVLTLLSPDFEIVWANKAAAESLSCPPEHLVGKNCYRLRHNSVKPCDGCPVARCFETGELQENIISTGTGTVWGVKAFPLKGSQGEVFNVIELATDITDKLKLKEEAERTSRLASLGELAAGVAHEINNPNALILCNGKILQDIWPDTAKVLDDHFGQQGDFMLGRMKYSRIQKEIPQLFEGIVDGSQRIKRIVDDLKDFVRQDPNQAMSEMDLDSAVHAAVRLVGNVIKKATDRFDLALAGELPAVNGHFQQLEQVIINLLVNACQALADKGEGILVSTFFDTRTGVNILEIRDEGRGIRPENLPHITDPFFTTRREVGGTGLGLSVSARIVKEHQGTLSFFSQPGQGTTVSMALPAIQETD